MRGLYALLQGSSHPQSRCNGGCAREAFGSAGVLCAGSPTCAQLPP